MDFKKTLKVNKKRHPKWLDKVNYVEEFVNTRILCSKIRKIQLRNPRNVYQNLRASHCYYPGINVQSGSKGRIIRGQYYPNHQRLANRGNG